LIAKDVRTNGGRLLSGDASLLGTAEDLGVVLECNGDGLILFLRNDVLNADLAEVT
jgi:hypothetical protein